MTTLEQMYKLVSLYCAKENILKITFFYDFDMVLLWFCYGLDMVDFMVFLCVSKSDMILICFFLWFRWACFLDFLD